MRLAVIGLIVLLCGCYYSQQHQMHLIGRQTWRQQRIDESYQKWQAAEMMSAERQMWRRQYLSDVSWYKRCERTGD